MRALYETKIIVIPAKAGAVSPAKLIQLLKKYNNINTLVELRWTNGSRLRGDDSQNQTK